MKSKLASLSLAALILCGVACQSTNKQPALRGATINPAVLRPGESAVITVDLADRHNIVDSVVAVVEQDKRVKLKLRDDGVAPDVEAGDGVWTLQVDAPFKAPQGDFTLIITAYRSDGQPIVVSDPEKGDVPLSTTTKVRINYDGADPAAEEAPKAAEPEAAAPQPAPEAPAPAPAAQP